MENTAISIQRRLENQALDIPGLRSAPQTKPLIEWVSKSLETLYAELEGSRSDLYESFVDRVFPEPEGRAFPAHTIAQVHPSAEMEELSIDWCRTVERTEVYLSPIVPVKIFDVKVRYQVTLDNIEKYGSFEKTKLAQLSGPLPVNCLCIGLEIPGQPHELGGLLLMFDGLSAEKYRLLPLIQFRCGGVSMVVNNGFPRHKDQTKQLFPDAEYLRLERIRKHILSNYMHKFFYLCDEQATLWQAKDTCPEYLGRVLPEEIKEENILWLELLLPDGFSANDLGNLNIQANCFPVWNARMIRNRGTYTSGSAIIPLDNEDIRQSSNNFLGIHKVWSDNHRFGPSEVLGLERPGYAVQSGYLGKFSKEELARRIEGLLQMMESYGITEFAGYVTEHGYELSGGYENLVSVIADIKNSIDLLKLQMARVPPAALQPHYYLCLQKTGSEMVYIDYFVTQGKFVSEQLWPYELHLISGEPETASVKTARLLMQPIGGRNALTMGEKEQLIREKLSEYKFF